MKAQPKPDYKSNDVVYTPPALAKSIYNHFSPTGTQLEPCRGGGAFYDLMPVGSDYCEIAEDKDFLKYTGKVDWIITNPPWSLFKDFLNKSTDVADNIVFLVTVNHMFTKARMRILKEKGFGIKEILLIDTPKNFPATGFQLGCIYIKKNYIGDTRINYL